MKLCVDSMWYDIFFTSQSHLGLSFSCLIVGCVCRDDIFRSFPRNRCINISKCKYFHEIYCNLSQRRIYPLHLLIRKHHHSHRKRDESKFYFVAEAFIRPKTTALCYARVCEQIYKLPKLQRWMRICCVFFCFLLIFHAISCSSDFMCRCSCSWLHIRLCCVALQ